ncbi:MAG: chemotaxis protein CheD [Spirochaetes bacterium]|nr:chemotaxis protein CheD [Spirochaetota bacterium]MBN2772047.1 chemotaxis protein CheD [Spirochaetota bacterium]
MLKNYSTKFYKNIITVHPGEYYVSSDDELIQTLLGSCVAVCLHDSSKGISGLNHFMLEGKMLGTNYKEMSTDGKHALHSISQLITDIISVGAKRQDLKAKVFGGGAVLSTEATVHTIPADNIRAAKTILEMEDIPIIQEDLGGKFTRKLVMDVQSGKVFLKKTLGSCDRNSNGYRS